MMLMRMMLLRMLRMSQAQRDKRMKLPLKKRVPKSDG